MLLARRRRFTRESEGVGFEPTVGFPTLDFESSALNRTQPPFLGSEKENVEPAYARSFGVASVQRPTYNFECNCVPDWALSVGQSEWPSPVRPGRQDCLPHEAKNVTIFGLPRLPVLLHLVCPHGRPRYYLLLTAVHRFLAPLFTSITSLFETSTLPYRHDSTQTRNSARVTE